MEPHPLNETRGLEVGQTVAVKVVHSEILSKSGAFKRFLREADIGKRARHKNVVATFDADATEANGKVVHFLVMEYVAGQTLRSLRREVGQVPESLCRHIGMEALRGLQAIHGMGIVHRDIKPENVLITQDHVVKLMDLGIAHLADVNTILSQPGVFLGTVAYAAPEQFRDEERAVDGRTDLYALGVVLYELATGTNPFRDKDLLVVMDRQLNHVPVSLQTVVPEVSPFFGEFVRTLLEKSPDLRFTTAEEADQVLSQGEASDWWKARAARYASKPPPMRRDVGRGFDPGLIGRAEELAQLTELVADALSGEGRVVLVEGEEGIGKTRLLDELVARVGDSNQAVSVLRGSFPPAGAATAISGFANALLDYFAPGNLEESLRQRLDSAACLAGPLAALIQGRPATGAAEPIPRESVPGILAELLAALARERPTVFIVEDLHLAPAEALHVFAALAVRARESRLLLIGTARDHAPEDWIAELDRLDYVSRLPLRRLGARHCAELLEAAFGSGVLTRDLLMLVGPRSDGNPLFLLEILRTLVDREYLVRERDGRWSLTRALDRVEIPATVREILESTIARLPEDDRDLLQLGACCGLRFDPLVVAAVLDAPRIPVLKRLAHLERHTRLIVSDGLCFRFEMRQVQDLLYHSLPPALRREYHASVGAALERLNAGELSSGKELDGELAMELCRHALAGGGRELAVKHLDRALEHGAQSHRHELAIELAGTALATPGLLRDAERVPILLERATHYDFIGRIEDEGTCLREAVAAADASGEVLWRARAYRALGAHLIRAAEYEGADDALETALDLSRRAGDTAVEAEATAGLGVALTHLGRFREALGLHEVALRLHRELGDERGVARTMTHLEFVLGRLGLYEDAWHHYEEAIAIANRIGYERGAIRATVHFAFALSRHGNQRAARLHLTSALDRAGEIGYRRGEAGALHGLGIVWEELDDPQSSLRHFEEAITLRRLIDDRRGLAASLIGGARILLSTQRNETAGAHLEEALGIARNLDLPAPIVLTEIHRSALPGMSVEVAEQEFNRLLPRLAHGVRMTAHALLWLRTDSTAHLESARDLLRELVAHAPEHLRDSMIRQVHLHREITRGWAEHTRQKAETKWQAPENGS